MAIGNKFCINKLLKGTIPTPSILKSSKHNINKLKSVSSINKNKNMLKPRGTLIMLSATMAGEDAILATAETNKKEKGFKKDKLLQSKLISTMEPSNGK